MVLNRGMDIEYKVGRGKIEIVPEELLASYPVDALVVPANVGTVGISDARLIDYLRNSVVGCLRGLRAQETREIFDELDSVVNPYVEKYESKLPFKELPFKAFLTSAGSLTAKHIIHSFIEGYDPKSDAHSLIYPGNGSIERFLSGVLQVGLDNNLESIAFHPYALGSFYVPTDVEQKYITKAEESNRREIDEILRVLVKHLQGERNVPRLSLGVCQGIKEKDLYLNRVQKLCDERLPIILSELDQIE